MFILCCKGRKSSPESEDRENRSGIPLNTYRNFVAGLIGCRKILYRKEAPAARPAHRTGPEEPLSFETMPSMAEVEAKVRRRSPGQTIVAICRDLGISPSLCEGTFWNRVFTAIHCYRGSVSKVVLEMNRREKLFDKEDWKHPNLGLPEQTREGIRRVLGFFIGEKPVNPFRRLPAPSALPALPAPDMPIAATATGPP